MDGDSEALAVIREWATPLTPLAFATMGLASGALGVATMAGFHAPALAGPLAVTALLTTALAAAASWLACCAVSALWRTVVSICCMDEAVCCSWLAC